MRSFRMQRGQGTRPGPLGQAERMLGHSTTLCLSDVGLPFPCGSGRASLTLIGTITSPPSDHVHSWVRIKSKPPSWASLVPHIQASFYLFFRLVLSTVIPLLPYKCFPLHFPPNTPWVFIPLGLDEIWNNNKSQYLFSIFFWYLFTMSQAPFQKNCYLYEFI